ncbi:MAG: rod shape-determining protein MreC [Prevotellaceae bacterium]|nr:rod shape-determining protein MreC [Prevotellaceae bacterium]
MRNLTEFLAKHFHWLLFVLLEAASVVLLISYNSYQSSVWFSSANAVSGSVYSWTSKVNTYFALEGVNKQLTDHNTQLELQLAKAQARIAELTGDSMAVKAEIPVGYRSIAARVVQNSIDKNDNLITIDKGSADGIRKDMGVVSGNGVVGIVFLVGTHYSVVIPVLNSQSNISCTIRNKGYFGYLRWTGPEHDLAYVEDVPRHAHYKNGDVIETSGYSSVFPKGLTVGKVVCTFNSPDGLSYRIRVKLATDFANLHDVCVIDNSPMQEQLDIMRAAQDSIATRQN